MNERVQRVALVAVALLIGVGISLALRQAKERGALSLTTVVAPPPVPTVSVRFRGTRVTGYEDSAPAWVLTAPVIDTERDRRTMRFPEGLTVTLLDQGKPAATLTAPTATFTDQTRLEFPQGLETTLLQDGKTRATLKAPYATFDTKARKFHAEGLLTATVLPPARPQPGELATSLGKLVVTAMALDYAVGTRLLTCPGTAKILTQKGHEAFGRDLTLNTENQDFSFAQLRGTIRASKDELNIL